MGPKRKQQHFVPEFLLGHFSSPGTDRIFAYDKWNDRVFPTTPEKAAKENGFYDFELNGVEASFEEPLDDLEGKTAPIVSKLLNADSLSALSDDERVCMGLFCAVQMIRDKSARAMALDMRDQFKAHIKKMGFNPKEVKGFEDPTDEDVRLSSIIRLAEAPKLLPYFLYYKNWSLLHAPAGTSLYTSDSPLTFHNENKFGFFGNLGLAVKGIEISLPLSSRVNLWITCDSIEQKFRDHYQKSALAGVPASNSSMTEIRKMLDAIKGKSTFVLRDENVVRFNSLQVSKAERFVYSANEDFSLARLMIQRNPELKHGHRYTVG